MSPEEIAFLETRNDNYLGDEPSQTEYWLESLPSGLQDSLKGELGIYLTGGFSAPNHTDIDFISAAESEDDFIARCVQRSIAQPHAEILAKQTRERMQPRGLESRIGFNTDRVKPVVYDIKELTYLYLAPTLNCQEEREAYLQRVLTPQEKARVDGFITSEYHPKIIPKAQEPMTPLAQKNRKIVQKNIERLLEGKYWLIDQHSTTKAKADILVNAEEITQLLYASKKQVVTNTQVRLYCLEGFMDYTEKMIDNHFGF